MTESPAIARGFIRELDGLRGIAILMVMVHRFWPRTGVGLGADVAGAGWIGVDLFFVISGFLICGILLDTKQEPGYFKNFYARRVLRIFPLYYLFVGGVWIVFGSNPAFREHAGSPLWYLLHLGNVPEGLYGNDVPYFLAPVWSLAIEEQFYLTFPWLVYFLDRRKLTYVLVGMIVLAPAIRFGTMLAAPEQERVQYLFTLCRMDTLAMGCLLAVVVRAVDLDSWRRPIIQLVAVAVPVVAVLGVVSRLDRTSTFDRVFGYTIVAVGCASVVALVILHRGHRAAAALRIPALTYLGKLCFGLYLFHRPADTIVSALADRLNLEADLWIMPFKIALAVLLATASWRLFERPILKLKDRFQSAQHPGASLAAIVLIVAGVACSSTPAARDGGAELDGNVVTDSALVDGDPGDGTPMPDGAVATGRVLYPEGAIHTPITPALGLELQAIAAAGAHRDRVFAKVGDSITATESFLTCFDGSADLGAHGDLAPTIAHFAAGDAAGATPFGRTSVAAKGGWAARDAVTGTPPPLDVELAAIDASLAVVLFGTNEARTDGTLDDFGTYLWNLVDRTLARGVIPILSTMPANVGYPAADARIPTFNRMIRALAQGRGVPLVDLHRALAPLPGRGISSDGLHPSVAPAGACVLTAQGLAYGYNMRNLVTLQVLARVRAALTGPAPDASAPMRAGQGTTAAPFVGALPLVDLGDTRSGETPAHGCGAASGHAVVYRVQLGAAGTVIASVVDRPGVDVRVHLLQGATCAASGDGAASAMLAAGTVHVVVEAATAAVDGEYLLVVETL